MVTLWVVNASPVILLAQVGQLDLLQILGVPVVIPDAAVGQALAVMDHPNLAKLIDGGLTVDRHPFFAMELARGEFASQLPHGRGSVVAAHSRDSHNLNVQL